MAYRLFLSSGRRKLTLKSHVLWISINLLQCSSFIVWVVLLLFCSYRKWLHFFLTTAFFLLLLLFLMVNYKQSSSIINSLSHINWTLDAEARRMLASQWILTRTLLLHQVVSSTWPSHQYGIRWGCEMFIVARSFFALFLNTVFSHTSNPTCLFCAWN